MKVRAQREPAVEALDERNAAALPVVMLRLAPVVGLKLVAEHPQEALADIVVVADAVAKAVWNRQDPLAHGHTKDNREGRSVAMAPGCRSHFARKLAVFERPTDMKSTPINTGIPRTSNLLPEQDATSRRAERQRYVHPALADVL